MAPKKQQESGAGFQQAAGLVRYFEAEEESALHMNPMFILGFAFFIAIALVVLQMWCPPGGPCFGG